MLPKESQALSRLENDLPPEHGFSAVDLDFNISCCLQLQAFRSYCESCCRGFVHITYVHVQLHIDSLLICSPDKEGPQRFMTDSLLSAKSENNRQE